MIFYTSIDDMPIYNWFKCVENSQFAWCLKEQKELNVTEAEKCKDAFNSIYNQFLDKYGISETLKDIIELQNKILVNRIEIALDGDKSRLLFIKIDTIELNKLLEAKSPPANYSKIAIEKAMGFQINTKQTTVTEYYDYLEAIKQDNGRG